MKPPQPGPPYQWDRGKSWQNLRDRGFGFDVIEGMDWSTALIWEDTREDYDEDRYVSIGPIGQSLYVVVWTPRPPFTRIISLRKADDTEVAIYAPT